jgi:hemolysin activation/secretion protein
VLAVVCVVLSDYDSIHSYDTPSSDTDAMFSASTRCLRAALIFCAVGIQSAAFGQVANDVAVGSPATPSFDILEFQIQGNTVLSAQAIELAVTPFLGERKQMDSVESARVALEKAYQGAGFLTVFVDVPEQRVDGGVVILNVTEGRVERLKVSGSRYFSQGYIRDKVSELADGKVPNFNEVQRQLALVNSTEQRRVQPIMRAGKTPGTVETELKVEDKLPLSGSVEVTNRAAADTKPMRVSLNARYDNLFQRDHSIALTLATAPQQPSLQQVVSLNYTVPSSDQANWVAYFVNSNSKVAALGDVNVLGKGSTLGWRYVRPVASKFDGFHSVSLGMDYKDLQEDTRVGANEANAATTISTPLRYLPLIAAYNGSLDHGAQRLSQINLQAALSFRPILRRELADCPPAGADQFACKRQGGDGGFATLRGDVRHSFPLGATAAAAGSLHLRLGAQVATGPVPSGEQFTIGGAESVRGYYEAEGAGDRAVLGSVEWRSPDFSSALSKLWAGDAVGANRSTDWFSQSYALAFLDVARTYVFDAAAGQAPRTSLAGVGFGLRAKLRKRVSGEFDVAWPLVSTVASPARELRAHLKLGVDF